MLSRTFASQSSRIPRNFWDSLHVNTSKSPKEWPNYQGILVILGINRTILNLDQRVGR